MAQCKFWLINVFLFFSLKIHISGTEIIEACEGTICLLDRRANFYNFTAIAVPRIKQFTQTDFELFIENMEGII